jgi:hypothetical protein
MTKLQSRLSGSHDEAVGPPVGFATRKRVGLGMRLIHTLWCNRRKRSFGSPSAAPSSSWTSPSRTNDRTGGKPLEPVTRRPIGYTGSVLRSNDETPGPRNKDDYRAIARKITPGRLDYARTLNQMIPRLRCSRPGKDTRSAFQLGREAEGGAVACTEARASRERRATWWRNRARAVLHHLPLLSRSW